MTGSYVPIRKETSPFEPGKPVPREFFVGRESEILRLMRAASQVASGKQENLFIIGERGIGKSSLASLLRYAIANQYKLSAFHIFLGGVHSLEEMIVHTIARIIQETYESNQYDRIKHLLGNYVQEINVVGVKINFDRLRDDAPTFAHDFLPFLRHLFTSLTAAGYTGISIILDDLNGITTDPKFSAFLKSMVDDIATSQKPLPLLLVLCGISERREQILQHQRSVERIFDIIDISPLEDQFVEDFFRKTFYSVNMLVENEALDILKDFSGGMPNLMHEMGDAAFWADKDNIIDEFDALRALSVAADNVGRKYFDQVQKALRSSDYQSILKKLGAFASSVQFQKANIEGKLNSVEKAKFNNFLQRMKKLNALKSGAVKGEYVFPNRLIQVYLHLESHR